jgi:hypothetical protein
MRKLSKLNANSRKEPTASRPMNQVFLSHQHVQMPKGMISLISTGILNWNEEAAKIEAKKKGKKAERPDPSAQAAPSNLPAIAIVNTSLVVPNPVTTAPVNAGQTQPAPVTSSLNNTNVPALGAKGNLPNRSIVSSL